MGKETTGLHTTPALFTLLTSLTTQALLVQPEHSETPTFLSLLVAPYSETKGDYRHHMTWCHGGQAAKPFPGHDSRLFSLPLIEFL